MNICQDMWRFSQLASKEPHDNSDPLVKDSIFTPMSNSVDYGYIAEFSDRLIISFRETRGLFTNGKFTPQSWWADLNTFSVVDTDGGTVHQGFYEGWKEFEKPITDYILHNVDPKKAIICEGYSRGAALCTHAAYHIANTTGPIKRSCSCINFGSPKVGKSDFRDKFSILPIYMTRVINGYDIVPEVPLWDMGFRDVGPFVKLYEPLWHKWFYRFRDHAEYNRAVAEWNVVKT